MLACASASPTPEPAVAEAPPPPAAPAPTPEPFALLLEEARTEVPRSEAEPEEQSAPSPEPPPAPAPEPPPPRPPEKLLILGDSMAATDFGQALEQVLRRDPRVQTRRRGKSSTGLARPDFFDWMAEGEKQVRLHQPDLVLVILGGNDGQDLIPKGGGARVIWNSPRWAAAYADRLAELTRVLGAEGRSVVFLGLPLMDRPRLEKKLRLIREVQARAIEALPGARYLDTRRCFVDQEGKLLRSVQPEGWRSPQPLRQDDGIHLTVAGARHFALCVAGLMSPLLNPGHPPSSQVDQGPDDRPFERNENG